MQEGIGRQPHHHESAMALHRPFRQRAHRRGRLAFRGPKAAEIMRAQHRSGCGLHPRHVQRPMRPAGAPLPQRRRHGAVDEHIPVGAFPGRETGVEIGIRRQRHGPAHRHRIRQMGIGAAHPGIGRPLRRGGELDDLFQRMHPGIGTSGTADVDGLPRHSRQRRFHRGLDRRSQTRHRGLLLPAAEIPAIVGHAADPAMTRHIAHLPIGRLRSGMGLHRQRAIHPPDLCLPVACQIVVHRHSRGVSVRYSARTHHSPRPGHGTSAQNKTATVIPKDEGGSRDPRRAGAAIRSEAVDQRSASSSRARCCWAASPPLITSSSSSRAPSLSPIST